MSGDARPSGEATQGLGIFRVMEYVVLLATFATTVSGVVRWLGSDSFPQAMWTVVPILGAVNAALVAVLLCVVVAITGAGPKLPRIALFALAMISAFATTWIFRIDETTVFSVGPVSLDDDVAQAILLGVAVLTTAIFGVAALSPRFRGRLLDILFGPEEEFPYHLSAAPRPDVTAAAGSRPARQHPITGEAIRPTADAHRARGPSSGAAESLAKVGFFRELRHGQPDGPSLRDAVGKLEADKRPITAYLQQAPVLAASRAPAYDVLAPMARTIGELYVLTDGVWVWPSDLAYYVQEYEVGLPAAFLQHGASRDWRPAVLSEREVMDVAHRFLGPR